VGPDDAPLVTLRGSHDDPHRYYSWMSRPDLPPNPMYRPWDELLARTTAPDAEFQTWTLRAGDCLVMHPKLIHSSEPWRRTTPGRRLSFSTRWLGDDAIWNPDPFTFQPAPLADHPAMRAGGPPPDELFPVIWRRAA
jgi:ectoine hydroxylase-related dioxygenase (phytanoyl-CoA dioxygenase family)